MKRSTAQLTYLIFVYTSIEGVIDIGVIVLRYILCSFHTSQTLAISCLIYRYKILSKSRQQLNLYDNFECFLPKKTPMQWHDKASQSCQT